MRYVGLIRGINVGRAKRVAMADLRAMIESLGYTGVRTILNSGNVVFTSARADRAAGERISDGLASVLNVPARVIVLDERAFDAAVPAEPPLEVEDLSRLQVAVPARAADLVRLREVSTMDWGREHITIGTRAAYLSCPAGVARSPLFEAVGDVLGDAVTVRTWTTMQKVRAAWERAS